MWIVKVEFRGVEVVNTVNFHLNGSHWNYTIVKIAIKETERKGQELYPLD